MLLRQASLRFVRRTTCVGLLCTVTIVVFALLCFYETTDQPVTKQDFVKRKLINDSLSVQPFSVIIPSTFIKDSRKTTPKLIPFRLRESNILVQSMISEFENATKTKFNVQDAMVPVVAKLKLSKDDVKKIHTEIWKRPANFTEYPIPSFDGRFLLNCQNICATDPPPLFVILIQTSTTNFLRRNVIRQSWANKNILQNKTMQRVFLVGKTRISHIQKLLELEQELHGDLVQGPFLDSYQNLTHKSVLGLSWASQYCRQAKYVIRVDDDVFLNIFKLTELLDTTLKNDSRCIWCQVKINSTIQRQSRQVKWPVDVNEFRNLSKYPMKYCNGPFSIMTNDIIPELFEASKITPFFWIEDVYISGLLPYVVGNVSVKYLRRIDQRNKNNPTEFDCFESKSRCEILARFSYRSEEIYNLWLRNFHQYKTLAEALLKQRYVF